MDNDTQKILRDRFTLLPKEVQDAITSPALRSKLQGIGKKHQLHLDKVGLLEDEAVLVMTGFTDPTDLPKQIEDSLRVSPEIAAKIADDIGIEVLMPIRTAMKAFVGNQAEVAPKETAPAAIANPPQPPAAQKPAVAPAPSAPSTPETTANPVAQGAVPLATATPSTPVTAPAAADLPAPVQELHPAELSLVGQTSSMPKTIDIDIPPKPLAAKQEAVSDAKKYTADPYREPVE